jgi:hypothetical protein
LPVGNDRKPLAFEAMRSVTISMTIDRVLLVVTVVPEHGATLVQFTLEPAWNIHIWPIPALVLALFYDTLA